MPHILVLAHKPENAQVMKSFLHQQGLHDITYIEKESEVRPLLATKSFQIILVDLPFTKDKHELSFCLSLREASNAFVMVLVKKEQYHSVKERIQKFGIFTIAKPILADVFMQSLDMAIAFSYRQIEAEKRNNILLDKIKEIKLVDRAKCLLIETHNMSEQEAHKYIEQKAMNTRMTRNEIASMIIKKASE